METETRFVTITDVTTNKQMTVNVKSIQFIEPTALLGAKSSINIENRSSFILCKEDYETLRDSVIYRQRRDISKL